MTLQKQQVADKETQGEVGFIQEVDEGQAGSI